MSAQEISAATIDFFNHIHHQAHQVMTTFEDSRTEKSRRLAAFEKLFKEEAAREEKQALESIAVILANLTSKKTAMVVEASKNVYDLDIQENKKLQQQMLSMQQISTDAKEELNNYVAKMENCFMKNTFSVAESRAMIENCLQE
ncbi:kinesin-like protein KIN-5B, partial [Carica papaya]|uniref:kinesin-like protein KIN-5B n=1 Tax=Carica papaya TaxID=3649 RepID=UPI000B8CBB5C